jgi:hypothetical protein
MKNETYTSIQNVDVAVIGGGTAGFAAAVAAARNGAKTLLIERYDCLGGTLTGGLVGVIISEFRMHKGRKSIYPKETNFEGEQTIKGIANELANRLICSGGAYGEKDRIPVSVCTNTEALKQMMDEMCVESGVNLWFGSTFLEANHEGGRLNSITVQNKSGRHMIKAKVFIDSSGDGDVSEKSGIPFVMGREPDGVTMPVSLLFTTGGVKLDETIAYLQKKPTELSWPPIESIIENYKSGKPFSIFAFRERLVSAYSMGDLPMAYGAENPIPLFAIHSVIRGGQVLQDRTAHIVDMAYQIHATDSKDYSKACIEVRKRIPIIISFLKKYIPGYQNCFLDQAASQLGVRETRRFLCKYTLTSDDITAAKEFDDAIAVNGGNMNLHSETGGKLMENYGGQKYKPVSKPYQIPLRCLIPNEINNLIIAGKTISCDRLALGSLRWSPVCIAIGQGAGTAAAIAVKSDVPVSEISLSELRQTLLEQEVLL